MITATEEKSNDIVEKKNLSFYAGKLFSGGLASSVTQASINIVQLLLLPVFTYYLAPKEYGILAMITLIISFTSLLYNPGLMTGLIRKYYDTEDEKEKELLFGGGLLFFVMVPLMFTILLVPAGPVLFDHIFQDFTFYPYGLCALVLAMFMQPQRLWGQLLTVQFKVPKLALYGFLGSIVGLLVSVMFVVVVNWGVNGRIIGMYAGTIFIYIISIVTLLKYIGKNLSLKKTIEIVKFGFPITVASWSYTILDLADRYMIERMINLEAVGIYSIGYTLASVPLFLSIGFRQMWSPVFFENMNSENYHNISMLMKYYLIGMASICGLIILFSKEVVAIFVNIRFESSAQVIPWITLGIFFLSILTLSDSFLMYEKRFAKISFIALIAAVSNILFNLVLIPVFGIIGAAIATFISYFIYAGLSVYIERKYFFKLLSLKHILVTICFLVFPILFTYYDNDQVSLWSIFLKVSIVVAGMMLPFICGYFSRIEIIYFKTKINKIFCS